MSPTTAAASRPSTSRPAQAVGGPVGRPDPGDARPRRRPPDRRHEQRDRGGARDHRRRPGVVHTVGPVIASLLVVDRAVLVPDGDGTLTAFDTRTGSLLWSVPLGAPMSRGPSMAAGVIYVGADDGTLTALDAASHQTRWSVNLGTACSARRRSPATACTSAAASRTRATRTTSSPLTRARAPSCGSSPHRRASRCRWAVSRGQRRSPTPRTTSVYALDAATGAVRWTYATDGPIGSLARSSATRSTCRAEIERCGPWPPIPVRSMAGLGRRDTDDARRDRRLRDRRHGSWPRRGDRRFACALTAAGRVSVHRTFVLGRQELDVQHGAQKRASRRAQEAPEVSNERSDIREELGVASLQLSAVRALC